MAKAGRVWIFLECPECGLRYYRTSVSAQAKEKLALKKFCPNCRRHILHKERKK